MVAQALGGRTKHDKLLEQPLKGGGHFSPPSPPELAFNQKK